jgi:hypothetical protein
MFRRQGPFRFHMRDMPTPLLGERIHPAMPGVKMRSIRHAQISKILDRINGIKERFENPVDPVHPVKIPMERNMVTAE